MNTYDELVKNTPTKTMCLKRNKNAFHLSTAALSTSLQNDQTHPPLQQRKLQPVQQETMPRITRHNIINQTHKEQAPSRFINNTTQKLSNTEYYKTLQSLISSENQTNKKRQFQKYMQSQTNTRSYIYKPGSQQNHESYQYCKNKQQNFPPHQVNEIYQKELRKSPDGKVNYHFGYLERTGYFYFSIESTLVLYSSKVYENSSDLQQIQPIIIQNEQLAHVLCIKQVVIQDLEVQDIQRHPFGQKNIVLLLWQPWRINFYAFQPQSLVKYQNLYIKLQVSCQCAYLIDYSSKGDVYYLSQSGQLGRITLFHRQITLTNFLNWNWNKKFSIRQYFFKFKHNTSRKYQKFNTSYANGVFNKIKQNYLNAKYFWSSKKTKGISLLCDRERKLLYTLVQTSLKNSKDYNRQTNQSHRQIRVYSIGRTFKSSATNVSMGSNLFDRLQAQIYSDPPILIRQITQQKLYQEIGSHFLSNTNLARFQVFGMYMLPQKTKTVEGDTSCQTNLVIMLNNCTRLFMFVSADRLILNEMINPPSMEQIIGFVTQTSRDQSSKNKCSLLSNEENFVVIGQKQPINFKLLYFLSNKQDRGLALFGVYKKRIIGILFTQNINQNEIGVKQQKNCENDQNIFDNNCNYNQEQIQVVWSYSLDQDMNIFVNQSDFKIFVTPQLQNNIFKKKIISHIQRRDPSKWQKRGKIGEKPIRRQVLHYPQQYLFLNKDKIMGITKLRPVDVFLSYLHQEINSKDHNYISTVMFNENLVRQLYYKIEIRLRSIYKGLSTHQMISMLTQIFCDVDGTYFCLQFAIKRCNRRKFQEKDNKKRQNLSTIRQDTYDNGPYEMKNNQKYRFTQKLHISNNFKKFRHSDLSSETFGQIATVRISNSPIKIRSQNSIMKLIQKLLMFIVKNQSIKKNNVRYRQFQPLKQKIYSATNQNIKGERATTKQIISSIFLYLSRVMCPIWHTPILNIHFSIFNFIAEIVKKIHQIYLKLIHQNKDIECIGHVLDFTAILVQYNLMLGALGSPPSLSYEQGFGIQKIVFEQSIFNSLQKIRNKTNISKTVNDWRSQFPNYFSLEIFKTLKIQAEISSIGDQKLKKQTVLKNSKQMPHYLIYSYYKDGTLSKKQINELLSNNKSTAQKQRRKMKSLNDLIMTDALDPYQKVQYAIKEIIKTQRCLEQKQFLVLYALQNLNSIRSLSLVQLQAKEKEVKKIQNIIKIQKLMLKQIQSYEIQQQSVNENTKRLINYYLLKPKQLKSLIGSLNNPYITLIFMCTIWDYEVNNANLQSVLRKISLNQKGIPISTILLKDKVSKIFISFPDSANRLPLIPFLNVFNQLASKQIQLEDLTIIIDRNQADQLKRYFWVPLFLSEFNWSLAAILDYYIDQCKKTYCLMKLQPQRRFLYNWISGYALVKFKYQEGRKLFQVSTEIILNLQKNQNLDAKILVNFMKDNLGY